VFLLLLVSCVGGGFCFFRTQKVNLQKWSNTGLVCHFHQLFQGKAQGLILSIAHTHGMQYVEKGDKQNKTKLLPLICCFREHTAQEREH
jgi:hypothetical protein